MLGGQESRELIDKHMLRVFVTHASIEGGVELTLVPRYEQSTRPANVFVRLLILAYGWQLLDAMQELNQVGAILLDECRREIIVLVDKLVRHKVGIRDGVARKVRTNAEEITQRLDHGRQLSVVSILGSLEVFVDCCINESIATHSQLLLYHLDANSLAFIVAGQIVLACQVAQNRQALGELELSIDVVRQLGKLGLEQRTQGQHSRWESRDLDCTCLHSNRDAPGRTLFGNCSSSRGNRSACSSAIIELAEHSGGRQK